MAIQARNRVPSAAANGKNGHSLISDEKFRQLYELALKLQMAGTHANGDGRGLIWLRGHEAALAGVAADLRDGDLTGPGEKWAMSRDARRSSRAIGCGLTRRNDAGKRVIEAGKAAVQDRHERKRER